MKKTISPVVSKSSYFTREQIKQIEILKQKERSDLIKILNIQISKKEGLRKIICSSDNTKDMYYFIKNWNDDVSRSLRL